MICLYFRSLIKCYGDFLHLKFATSNIHKFQEASAILEASDIELSQHVFSHREIRSDSLEEIAREAVQAAFHECKKPVFVEDTGLFVDALNGFPGTYSGWALGKIGVEGLLKLMADAKERTARFETCIAYHDGSKIHVFHGVARGSIARKKQGKSGFGYDPIFIPEGHEQTFAESGFASKLILTL